MREKIREPNQAETHETAPPRPEHLGYLDSLRALAALYVLWYHAASFVSGAGLPWWLNQGQSAVDVFLCLSGFCLMLPVVRSGQFALKGGSGRFYLRRAARILPPYYASVALSLLLIALCLHTKTGTAWDHSIPVTERGVLSHLLLWQDSAADTARALNAPLWSIACEWRIYLLFPILVWGWRRLGPLPATVVAVALGYGVREALVRWALGHHGYLPSDLGVAAETDGAAALRQAFPAVGATFLVPEYLGVFAVGALGAGIAFSEHPWLARLRERVRWPLVACVFGFWAYEAATSPVWYLGDRVLSWPRHGECLIVACWISTTLVSVATGRVPWLRTALSFRPLVAVGGWSYSLYLIHYPLLALEVVLLLRLGWSLSDTARAVAWLGPLPILPLAWLFWRIIELPAHAWAKLKL